MKKILTYSLAALLFSVIIILPGCARPDTLRYIVRGSGVSEIKINNVTLDDFIEPGVAFEGLTPLGTIRDSSLVQTEYGRIWHLSLPGMELEFTDAGEPALHQILITNPDIPVTLDGENIFDWIMDEPTLARLGAIENRDDQMTLQEKFGGAPEYWELFVDPETGKVIRVRFELGVH